MFSTIFWAFDRSAEMSSSTSITSTVWFTRPEPKGGRIILLSSVFWGVVYFESLCIFQENTKFRTLVCFRLWLFFTFIINVLRVIVFWLVSFVVVFFCCRACHLSSSLSCSSVKEYFWKLQNIFLKHLGLFEILVGVLECLVVEGCMWWQMGLCQVYFVPAFSLWLPFVALDWLYWWRHLCTLLYILFYVDVVSYRLYVVRKGVLSNKYGVGVEQGYMVGYFLCV